MKSRNIIHKYGLKENENNNYATKSWLQNHNSLMPTLLIF